MVSRGEDEAFGYFLYPGVLLAFRNEITIIIMGTVVFWLLDPICYNEMAIFNDDF